MKKQIRRRNTEQRRVILEELRNTTAHPTAETFYQKVRDRMPSISFGTVYRNLRLLAEEGSVLELTCDRSKSHYDGTVKDHYHFICLKCGTVRDLSAPIVEGLDETARRGLGVEVKYHRLDFYGCCRECGPR